MFSFIYGTHTVTFYMLAKVLIIVITFVNMLFVITYFFRLFFRMLSESCKSIFKLSLVDKDVAYLEILIV